LRRSTAPLCQQVQVRDATAGQLLPCLFTVMLITRAQTHRIIVPPLPPITHATAVHCAKHGNHSVANDVAATAAALPPSFCLLLSLVYTHTHTWWMCTPVFDLQTSSGAFSGVLAHGQRAQTSLSSMRSQLCRRCARMCVCYNVLSYVCVHACHGAVIRMQAQNLARFAPRYPISAIRDGQAKATITPLLHLPLPPLTTPQDLPGWSSTMNAWGSALLAAARCVAAMAALGWGLPIDSITQLMDAGPHLLAPTGSNLAAHGTCGTVLAGACGRVCGPEAPQATLGNWGLVGGCEGMECSSPLTSCPDRQQHT
jgi:hypothetical protein